MKKLTLLFCLFIAAGTSALAQFEIRPLMGINLSDISETPDGFNTQARIGAQVGGSVMFGNKFHFMPGLAWFTRSTEYSIKGTTKFDQTINGVMVPLLLGYRFVDASTKPFMNVRLFAGPSMMFLTKTEISEGQTNEVVDWNNVQWGAQMGLGIDIAIFFFDLGYEFGLSNTGEGELVQGFTDIRSNTFYLNAGVRLTFSR